MYAYYFFQEATKSVNIWSNISLLKLNDMIYILQNPKQYFAVLNLHQIV